MIQITPNYSPEVSGVGDYAAVLSAKFGEAGEPMTTFVARPGARDAHGMDDVTYLPQPEPEAIAQAIDTYDRVLLHFSGYGYARRGLCRWLVDGLSRWKARSHTRRLVTMFHEVYATGPIWRSSFWTSAAQKRIARDLAMLSDAAFVSSKGGYDQLQPMCQNCELEVLEVFSNVGEADTLRPLADRSPHAVVFGGAARRTQVYRALQTAGEGIVTAFRDCGVMRIVDIGPWIDAPPDVAGCPIQVCGPLPAADVSDLLSDARLGFVNYRRDKITKSGIAAAYFAHGLLVLNTGDKGRYTTNIQEGVHLVDLWRLRHGPCDAPAVAAAGWKRYRPHGIEPTVQRLRAALGNCACTRSEEDWRA